MKNKTKFLNICIIILIIILLLVIVYNCIIRIKDKPLQISRESERKITQFNDYFGENKSNVEVELLIVAIQTNNVKVDYEKEAYKKIFIAFGKSKEKLEIKTPQEIKQMISKNKTYWIGIMNNNSTSEIEEKDIKVSSEGYYSNGNIRLITIYEN